MNTSVPSKSTRPRRRVRPLALLAAVLALVVGVFVIPHTRVAVLHAAGEMLVVNDTLEHADLIVIATDADGAGVLEATDLIHAGYATHVALFPDPPDAVDREFLRRGVPYYNMGAVSQMQLRSLGINSTEFVPWSVSGTEDEGNVLRRWVDQTHVHTIIFVSMADHARRSRRILDRALKGSTTKVILRYSRYSNFKPDTWWRSRGGVRIEIVESQKLLLDYLRHLFA